MLTIIEKVLLLQSVDIFSHVRSEELSFLAAIADEITAEPGTLFYKEGDAPDGLYVVVSGSVLMRRGREAIERIAPGGSFGVWALFDDSARLAAAESTEESRLLFVSRDDFYDILADHVEIVQGVFKHLVQRLRKLASAVEA